MEYFRFFRAHGRLLSFGLLLTFFSGFGQTFLFSLYVPSFVAAYPLGYAQVSSLYAGATLASAFSLPYLGKFIDQLRLQTYATSVILGLATALTTVALSSSAWVLGVGIWGMRLAGQGLMSHTSLTTMSRFFDHARGKALSIASLGHPFGEATFPIIIALLIGNLGWRCKLGLSALTLLVIVLPLVRLLLAGVPAAPAPAIPTGPAKSTDKSWSQCELVRDRRFVLLAPNFFTVGAIGTALFFHQLALAAHKGWSPEWIALCFTGFALASVTSMLLAGPLIDRFAASRLFALYLLPFVAGLLVLLLFRHPAAGMVYMILTGLTMGAGSTIRSAIQAELYGVRAIGAVRSVFTTLLIISTAIGPAVFGYLLDGGFDFDFVVRLSLAVVLLTILWSVRVVPAFTFRRLLVRVSGRK